MTWCRDPDPPALDYGLSSIHVDADALSDTVIAILDWDQPAPGPAAAASAAGLPLASGVQLHPQPALGLPDRRGHQAFAPQLDRAGGKLIARAA